MLLELRTGAALLLLSSRSLAAEEPAAVPVPRVEAALVLDGVLDEPVWEQAARLTGFHQYQPVDGRPAEEETEVRVFYTPTAICFGITARDSEPGAIRATVADRDNIDADDNVTLHLDTFHDRRRSFFFAVNPLGVQQDGVRTEGSNSPGQAFGGETDKNPDFVFESKGRIGASGYVVEVRIPFKSLRYPGGAGPQRWGLNVVRTTQRTGRVDTWTDVRRASASFLSQAGTLEGLQGLHRGVLFEGQPFLTAAADGRRRDDGAFARESVDPSVGLNLKLGLTPDVSLDATANPDFSHVESDVGAITVNERFALFYPEKRPFFLEGIELFATPNQLVYTRRIADPVAGLKVSAKRGRWNLAHLTAVDDAESGRALFNVSRVHADYGQDSTAGLTLTDRAEGARRNTVLAADTRHVFGKLYFLRLQAGGSRTDDGAAVRSAPLWLGEVDRTGRAWGFNYRIAGIGREFRSDAGYVPRHDLVQAHVFNRVSFYGAPDALVQQLTFFAGPEWTWRYGDFGARRPVEDSVGVTNDTQLRGGWRLRARAGRDSFRHAPDAFAGFAADAVAPRPYFPVDLEGGWLFFVGGTTPAYQAFDADAQLTWGAVPLFAEGSTGRQTSLALVVNLRGGGRVRVAGHLTLSRLTRQRDRSEFARVAIPRLRLEYQPHPALFFRAVAEYQAQRRDLLRDARSGRPLRVDGAPSGRDDSNRLRADLLLSYEPTPGTVAFFGYGAGLDNGARFGFDSLARATDGFFVKLAYRFRK